MIQASSWKEQELLDERLAEVEAQKVGAWRVNGLDSYDCLGCWAS